MTWKRELSRGLVMVGLTVQSAVAGAQRSDAAGGLTPSFGTPQAQEAQRLIRSDRDAVLVYAASDSGTTLWVIRKKASKSWLLPSSEILRPQVEELWRGLSDRQRATSPETRSVQHRLYQALLAPAASLLDDAERWIVVSDGVLEGVPFEALLVREPRSNRASTRDYVLGRHAVSYAHSVAWLATPRGPAPVAGIVALGNPWYGPPGNDTLSGPGGTSAAAPLSPLPFTAEEVVALQRLSGERPTVPLLGRDATRERLLSVISGAEILHIGAHCLVDESDSARSGLWLAANGSDPPGRIQAAEVAELDLDAAIVTLSACEVRPGASVTGGVTGLSGAFLAAGARSVIASLWSVEDRASSTLMRHFYGAVLGSGARRDQALRSAKRALLKRRETASPYYWAPFLLIGEGGSLR